jgi:hypothetical protein
MLLIMNLARQLALSIAEKYAAFGNVHAVALAGSQSGDQADTHSDIDLYVYVTHPLTLDQRTEIAGASQKREIGNAFWEPGDEWVDEHHGISVDAMFRDVRWIEEQVSRVMHDHQASVGYSTCFVYNVRNSEILFDRDGWFAALQQRASAKYPAALKQAVVAKNHPILRNTISSYTHQIESAIRRGDHVSVNHRTAALLASYFDVLFAVNEQFHPGEKRLVRLAQQLCRKLPARFPAQLEEVLSYVSQPHEQLMSSIHRLLDSLDELLRSEQLI